MIDVSAAKAKIINHLIALQPLEKPIDKACRHILAEDCYAQYDIPAFRQSSMDGYAFQYEADIQELRLVGEMAAGASNSLSINSGETSRIFTGAPLPIGADTVVMQEKISLKNGRVVLNDISLKPGTNVREKGAEIKAGALAMAKGSLLTPAAIGFLAGIGITTVSVFPMPKVSIISTGKELQQPGVPLKFGQVYESNAYSLKAALQLEGIDQIEVFHADDDLQILISVLEKALLKADVVLLTGGVSVGDYDFVIGATQRCGVEQHFHKVKQKPGKPLYFGKKGAQLIFGLPGNPSSVLSSYYNYVLPAVKRLSHLKNSVKEIKAELSHPYQKTTGLTHFLKGIYENGKATPLSAQESFRLSSFAHANCLICLPEEQEIFNAGDAVNILLLPD
ncbi:molybdopterin molybdotransferase MoeA [Pedobacter sp.]|uniref:molybdopterin molybdotransferase MoeA n=1 Tax=Pedobacter sp. TaxID=1411316 RepID=UPI003D7FE6B7